MKTINTHEAKTHLSRILSDVESGEVYIVARGGKPIAQLVPYRPAQVAEGPGGWKGRVVIHEDFDAEDGRLTALFEGGED